MKNNLEIFIPASVIVEWQNEIEDGPVANQWWQTLTEEQQKLMSEAALLYLRKQKIKESQAQSDLLTKSLIRLSQSAGHLELAEDDSNRLIISGLIERGSYGVKGQCYSQTPEFVGSMCDKFLGGYSEQSSAHKHGQQTVDVICYALNALPSVTASQTPPNSVADVGLRWDVIIKWNNCYFPIQVKSSPQGIDKALELGYLGSYAEEKIEQLWKKIEDVYRYKHSKETIKHTEAYYQSKQDILKMLIGNYENSMPLYIWANQSTHTVRSLVELFANSFKIGNQLEEYQEQAVEAYTKKYPDPRELMKQRIEEASRWRRQTSRKQPEQDTHKQQLGEQVIQGLKEQIKGKHKRIRNRKARKRPIILEHAQALQLAKDALKRVQELIEGEKRGIWYKDSTLFKQVQKLRDIERETNSPMIKQTEELFALIEDFTDIKELSEGYDPEFYLNLIM